MRVYRDRKAIKSNMMLDLPDGEQPSLTEIYDSVSDGQSKGGIYNVNRINGGVKVYHLAEQKYTTHSLYSRDHPGCQYSILTSSFLLPG